MAPITALVHLSLVLLVLSSSRWSTVSGARIRVQLSEMGVARLQDDADDGETACEDYTFLTAAEISTLSYPRGFEDVRQPWKRPSVSVGRSEYVKEGVDKTMEIPVAGLGGDTLRDVVDTLRDGGCLVFIFGGTVRDQFLGDVPRDADMDTNCNTEALLSVCVRAWGPQNCKGTSPVFHIGNPTQLGEEDLDIAEWDSFFFGPKTNLEYTTNSISYSPDLDVLVDIGFTGVMDTCARKIRIPVCQSDWLLWTSSMLAYRYWKMRVKDFTGADDDTQQFVVAEALKGIEDNPAKFQEFFCRKALPGEWDKAAQTCFMHPSFCSKVSVKKAKYYAAFEQDLGAAWPATVKPLLDELNICTTASFSDERENTYFQYLLNQLRQQLTRGNYRP